MARRWRRRSRTPTRWCSLGLPTVHTEADVENESFRRFVGDMVFALTQEQRSSGGMGCGRVKVRLPRAAQRPTWCDAALRRSVADWTETFALAGRKSAPAETGPSRRLAPKDRCNHKAIATCQVAAPGRPLPLRTNSPSRPEAAQRDPEERPYGGAEPEVAEVRIRCAGAAPLQDPRRSGRTRLTLSGSQVKLELQGG